MVTELSTTSSRRLVRWQIVFTQRGLEATFPAHEELLPAEWSEADFETWAIARFAERLGETERPERWREKDYPPGVQGPYVERLPEGAGRYLRVDHRVLACYDDWEDYEDEKLDALAGIREAIEGEHGRFRVRLPKTGSLAGPLDDRRSEFGDEFFHLPKELGRRPPAGETKLTGFIHFTFQKPEGHVAPFTFRYVGVGTPVTITWGGGQEFLFERTRIFPLPILPDGNPAPENQGKLDLRTGEAEIGILFSVFQGTTIGRTDRINRIPYAFPYFYPPSPPVPPPPPTPPGFEPPPGDLGVFAKIRFAYDWDGHITGCEIASETIALVGLFPFAGLFPPWSFGPSSRFFFANPDRCLPGTPPASCFSPHEAPDGLPTPVSVFFHPHVDLVSEELAEAPAELPPAPSCMPRAVGRAASAVAGGRLWVIGGLDDDGISDRVQSFDPSTGRWEDGPPLPTAVFGAQAAAVGSRIYVAGGFRTKSRKIDGSLQVLDLDHGEWKAGPDLPVPVAEGTAASVGAKVYVVSGWSGKDEISAAVQIFDTEAGSWSRGADAALPVAGAAAVAVDDRIYVINGRYAGDHVTDRTAIYETSADEWAIGPSTEVGVIAAVAGRVGRRVYLVGGRGKVGGPSLKVVQELDLDRDRWRLALPQPMETAASAGGSAGGALWVVGGRTQVGEDPDPGRLVDLVQVFRPAGGWLLCGSRPIFVSTGVMNAAGLTVGPPFLAPGVQAVVAGDRFAEGPAPPPDAVEITVAGEKAQVLRVQPNRVDFVVPEGVDLGSGKAELVLRRADGAEAPPVEVPIQATSPGLFTFTYGELFEPAFLLEATALACNGDGTVNAPDQPAAPGDELVLYATGLGKDPDADELKVTMGVQSKKNAKVQGIGAGPVPGVVTVTVEVPKGTGFSNNVPLQLRYGDEIANPVVVTVGEAANRPPEPIPCEAGVAVVFGLQGKSTVAYQVEELSEERVEEASLPFHAASDLGDPRN